MIEEIILPKNKERKNSEVIRRILDNPVQTSKRLVLEKRTGEEILSMEGLVFGQDKGIYEFIAPWLKNEITSVKIHYEDLRLSNISLRAYHEDAEIRTYVSDKEDYDERLHMLERLWEGGYKIQLDFAKKRLTKLGLI